MGSRDGTFERKLASNQCGLHLVTAWCLTCMWVEFVIGSRIHLRFFSRFSSFPSSTKTNISKFQSTRIEETHKNSLLYKYCYLLYHNYLAGLVTTFSLCALGRAISGYDHFGQCGRIVHEPAPREPTVGETMIEEYRKANPKRTLRTKLCPRCHQKCLKENNNNNHLKCWACKTGFCYQCGKEIKGAVTMHFAAASSCTQHSDD